MGTVTMNNLRTQYTKIKCYFNCQHFEELTEFVQSFNEVFPTLYKPFYGCIKHDVGCINHGNDEWINDVYTHESRINPLSVCDDWEADCAYLEYLDNGDKQ